jgi:hypothetical protein
MRTGYACCGARSMEKIDREDRRRAELFAPWHLRPCATSQASSSRLVCLAITQLPERDLRAGAVKADAAHDLAGGAKRRALTAPSTD